MEISPAVSVVIPTAGRDYLWTAVDSVLGQTFSDFEVVIVADGCSSTWDLSPLVEKDPRVRVVDQVRRGGESISRNVGLAQAKGDLIALLDDDDVMLPSRLERQVQALQAHPEAALAYTSYEIIDDDGKLTGVQRLAVPTSYEQMLEDPDLILLPTVMVRRDAALAVGGFSPLMRIGGDIDFILKVLRRYPKAACIEEILFQSRRHASNTSGHSWAKEQELADNLSVLLRTHLTLARLLGESSAGRSAAIGLRGVRRWRGGRAFEEIRRRKNPDEKRSLIRLAATAIVMNPMRIVAGGRRLLPGGKVKRE
jgi:glycosyltransferase involved in cell wall biosynthesis